MKEKVNFFLNDQVNCNKFQSMPATDFQSDRGIPTSVSFQLLHKFALNV